MFCFIVVNLISYTLFDKTHLLIRKNRSLHSLMMHGAARCNCGTGASRFIKHKIKTLWFISSCHRCNVRRIHKSLPQQRTLQSLPAPVLFYVIDNTGTSCYLVDRVLIESGEWVLFFSVCSAVVHAAEMLFSAKKCRIYYKGIFAYAAANTLWRKYVYKQLRRKD